MIVRYIKIYKLSYQEVMEVPMDFVDKYGDIKNRLKYQKVFRKLIEKLKSRRKELESEKSKHYFTLFHNNFKGLGIGIGSLLILEKSNNSYEALKGYLISETTYDRKIIKESLDKITFVSPLVKRRRERICELDLVLERLSNDTEFHNMIFEISRVFSMDLFKAWIAIGKKCAGNFDTYLISNIDREIEICKKNINSIWNVNYCIGKEEMKTLEERLQTIIEKYQL
jgi:hypothetical protein